MNGTVSLEFTTLLDILALVQAVLLALLLISRDTGTKPTKYLGLFLLAFSADLIPSILVDIGRIEDNLFASFLPLRFLFLSGPLLYIYARRLTRPLSPAIRKRHLVPGLIEFVILSTITALYSAGAIERGGQFDWKLLNDSVFFIGLLFSLVYLIVILRLIHTNKQRLPDYFSHSQGRELNWLKHLCYALILLVVAWVGLNVWVEEHNRAHAYLFVSGFNALTIFYTAFQGVRQQSMDVGEDSDQHSDGIETSMDSNPFIDSPRTVSTIEVSGQGKVQSRPIAAETAVASISLRPTSELEGSRLDPVSEPELNEDFARLLGLMEREEPFLKLDLQSHDIAEQMGMPVRKLSELIKKETNNNFRNFINSYRIEEAQRILLSDEADQLNMHGVALESGFNSRATFYAVFKKSCDCSPADYKYRVQKTGQV